MSKQPKLNFVVSNLSFRDNQSQKNFYLEAYLAPHSDGISTKKNFGNELVKNKKSYEKYSNSIHKKYLKYIPILAKRLDDIHNERNGTEYWALVLSMGMVRYISVLYYLHEKYKNYFSARKFDFQILSENKFLRPFEFEDQRQIITNTNLGREQLFSIYCQTILSANQLNFLEVEKGKENFEAKKRSKILLVITKIINNKYLARNCKTLILGCSFNLKYRIKLFFSSFFSGILTLKIDEKEEKVKINYKNRAFLSSTENKFDKFDKFFFKSLESLFPIAFLESYKSISSDYSNIINTYPKLQRVFSEQFISNSYYSLFLGVCRKNNISINAVQHNGLISPFIGKYEEYLTYMCDFYYIHDEYLKGRSKGKYIKSSSLHPVYTDSAQSLLNFKKYKILFLMGPVRITPIHFNAAESGDNIFYERNAKFSMQFFNNLNIKPKSLIFYRPYPHTIKGLFYNKEKDFSKYIDVKKRKLSCRQSLKSQIKKSNLIVIDYISTAYLEAFLLNIPTVVFFNKNIYFLKNSKLNIFSELISAGVFQTNPESAANLINKIYIDPKKWWDEEKVQSAVKNFLKKNLNLGDRLFNQIVFFEDFN